MILTFSCVLQKLKINFRGLWEMLENHSFLFVVFAIQLFIHNGCARDCSGPPWRVASAASNERLAEPRKARLRI